MAPGDLTARTHSMTATTVAFGDHQHPAPSRRAAAALSIHRAYALTDESARGRAIGQHFDRFPLEGGEACHLRRG